MIFQSRLDYQLNNDFLQSATFICAAPSLLIEPRTLQQNNQGIQHLKEQLILNILPDNHDFDTTRKQLHFLNDRIMQYERNFENVFLNASSETLKELWLIVI